MQCLLLLGLLCLLLTLSLQLLLLLQALLLEEVQLLLLQHALMLQLALLVRVGRGDASQLVWVALDLLQEVAEALDGGWGEVLGLRGPLAQGVHLPGPHKGGFGHDLADGGGVALVDLAQQQPRLSHLAAARPFTWYEQGLSDGTSKTSHLVQPQ